METGRRAGVEALTSRHHCASGDNIVHAGAARQIADRSGEALQERPDRLCATHPLCEFVGDIARIRDRERSAHWPVRRRRFALSLLSAPRSAPRLHRPEIRRRLQAPARAGVQGSVPHAPFRHARAARCLWWRMTAWPHAVARQGAPLRCARMRWQCPPVRSRKDRH